MVYVHIANTDKVKELGYTEEELKLFLAENAKDDDKVLHSMYKEGLVVVKCLEDEESIHFFDVKGSYPGETAVQLISTGKYLEDFKLKPLDYDVIISMGVDEIIQDEDTFEITVKY